MTVTINGTNGVTTPEVVLDNSAADGAQVVLKSSGYSDWNLDNYSGRLRAYYGSTEYWTVNASGNVGMGTSSPGVRADIVDNANNSQGQLRVSSSSSFGTRQTFVSTSTNGRTWQIGANFWIGNGEFSVVDLTANAQRMSIDSNGNLLVGTTSTGNSNSKSFVANVANGYIVVNHLNGQGSGSGYASFGYNGGEIGYISQNGTTAVAYNTTSDYRLKENVQPMTGALAKVAALKPVTYKWKADGSDGEGFIAHELAEVCPHAVTGEKDAVKEDGTPQYQGIDTSFLVATLTAAIQELKAIVDAQGAEIAALKGQP